MKTVNRTSVLTIKKVYLCQLAHTLSSVILSHTRAHTTHAIVWKLLGNGNFLITTLFAIRVFFVIYSLFLFFLVSSFFVVDVIVSFMCSSQCYVSSES